MADYTLRYGDSQLHLTKSIDTVALAPQPGADQRVTSAALSRAEDTEIALDTFRVARLAKSRMEHALDTAREHPEVAVGSHVYHTSDDGVPFVPNGQLYVRFTEGTKNETANALLAEQELMVEEVRGEREVIVAVTPGSENPIKCAIVLQRSSEVEIAEPDLLTPGEIQENDPLLAAQWHLHNTGSIGGSSISLEQGADARVVAAWQRARNAGVAYPMGSPDIALAVIDDGFDLGHPDLSGSGKVVAPWDFKRGNDQPLPNPAPRNKAEQDWHGTACAGIATGNANGVGIVGAAPRCRLMPIRWGACLSDEQFEAWFRHALRHGAAVISCSWGVKAKVYELSHRKRAQLQACADFGRGGLGTVVCFAAGNHQRDIQAPDGSSLNGFATHPAVLAIAASTSMDKQATYSNFGAKISLCAPAGGGGGRGIVTSDVRGTYSLGLGQRRSQGYSPGAFTRGFTGTSSACPLVAGICALLLSIRPDLTAGKVKEVLEGTTRKIGGESAYDSENHSNEFGYGCVNALAAVEKVLGG